MTEEKRIHQRHELRLGLFCQSFGGSSRKFVNGTTVNVSTGGMFFEAGGPHFKNGDIVTVSLFVPPTEDLLASGGTMTGIGRVTRTVKLAGPSDLINKDMQGKERHGIAVQWLRPPKLGP